jgi:hypothetical protein
LLVRDEELLLEALELLLEALTRVDVAPPSRSWAALATLRTGFDNWA